MGHWPGNTGLQADLSGGPIRFTVKTEDKMGILSDKVAIVTGAGGGIGRAIALAYAAEGCLVAGLDIDPETAEAVTRDAEALAGRSAAVALDITDRAALHRAIAVIAKNFGRINILVNNAMWVKYEPIEAIDETTVDRMFATGLKAALWGIQAVVPAMAAGGGGSIINLGSPAAEIGIKNAAVYTLVKGGIAAFTRQAASELGARNIRVNAIAPGPIRTPGAMRVLDEAAWKLRVDRTPLGHLGTPEDIAKTALFLASEQSAFVTGTTVRTDGGLTVNGG
jgi:NAD(P)-dependent dehydrogenase (short-subunit alcohol dehydrogenase family)